MYLRRPYTGTRGCRVPSTVHPPLHEAGGHVFGPQPGFSQSLDLELQLG
jgi:hypothetical protein